MNNPSDAGYAGVTVVCFTYRLALILRIRNYMARLRRLPLLVILSEIYLDSSPIGEHRGY